MKMLKKIEKKQFASGTKKEDTEKIEIQKSDKQIVNYIFVIRMWYFLCPFLSLIMLYYQWNTLWKLFEACLVFGSVVCLWSQFFSGNSLSGIDYEQVWAQEEAEERSKLSWGIFRVSPFFLCLPAIIVVSFIEVPKILPAIFSYLFY